MGGRIIRRPPRDLVLPRTDFHPGTRQGQFHRIRPPTHCFDLVPTTMCRNPAPPSRGTDATPAPTAINLVGPPQNIDPMGEFDLTLTLRKTGKWGP